MTASVCMSKRTLLEEAVAKLQPRSAPPHGEDVSNLFCRILHSLKIKPNGVVNV